MPSTENTESIVLALAAFLFAFALISLLAWALKSFVLTGRSGASYLKGAITGLAWCRLRRSMRSVSSSSSAATTSST